MLNGTVNNRAIRLELVKPVSDSWEEIGSLLRLLANATPKLLNAALDARVAVLVAGKQAVKSAIAPDAKAASPDGLAYQAVLRTVESLRAWGAQNDAQPARARYAKLEVPSGMSAAIARAACQAFSRRDQERPHFASERILVRAAETQLVADDVGHVLHVGLRSKGRVAFAVARSWGTHAETLKGIASGVIPHGDVKIQWDDRRSKWYALLSYAAPEPAPMTVDPQRVLAVHRGVRNALTLLPSTGTRALYLRGGKFAAQRRKLHARASDIRRTSAAERGGGAKGHGKSRRFEQHSALDDKIARVTKTWCQQAAAFVQQAAERMGCGLIVIEDYGGIEPHENVHVRRVLDRFPLHELKLAVVHCATSHGHTVSEVPAAWISSTCPVPECGNQDTRQHNTRTNVFHCAVCGFERPADWLAAYWMLRLAGYSAALDEQLSKQAKLAGRIKQTG